MKVKYIESDSSLNDDLVTLGNIYDVLYLDRDGDYWIINDKGIEYPLKPREVEVLKSDQIVESVINQFKTRSDIGIKKYGTTLERNDLSTLEWLQHLQEELMDAVCYIEKLKNDNK